VTNRTNNRTIIASLSPPESIFAHAAQYVLFSNATIEDQLFVLGIMCSRIFDWFVRNIVESNITFYLLHSFPIPRVSKKDKNFNKFINIVGSFYFNNTQYSNWAKKINFKKNQFVSLDKDVLKNEIDALAAIFFGLSKDDLQFIYENFHETWNYKQDLKNAISFYDKKDKKVVYLK
jgi:hypothetical protein